MAAARARARPRPPVAAASAATPSELENVTPDTARMRKALELTAANRTQTEIAKILGCTDRTVRNILKAARSRQLHTFRAKSAEAIVADVEHRAAVNYGRWTALYVRARQAGDLRAETAILARMDAALVGRVALLARVGFFDNVTFTTGDEGDAGARNMMRARAEIGALVAMSAALNRGEDVSEMDLGVDTSGDDFDPDDPIY